jgi:DNA-binding transcriptional ArsR family regulator
LTPTPWRASPKSFACSAIRPGVRILDALSRTELCVGDLASQLNVSESAVSHQLRLLRNTRIVRARREGRMIFYALDDKHVLALFRQGLRHVQEAGR